VVADVGLRRKRFDHGLSPCLEGESQCATRKGGTALTLSSYPDKKIVARTSA
jgi:hypothetical protein